MISDSQRQTISDEPQTTDAAKKTASVWLALAVTALTVSTAYVLVILIVRSGFTHLINNSESFFQTALVLHVDFALIVWLLSMAACIWSLSGSGQTRALPRLDALLAGAGIALMVLSPLLGAGSPVISDYLLLLDHPLFLIALGLFFCGVTLAALRLLSAGGIRSALPDWPGITVPAVRGSVLAFICAISVFFLTLADMTPQSDPRAWYGILFWGAGHLLQFCYLFLLLAAWSWLLRAAGLRPRLDARYLRAMLWVLLLAVISGPLLMPLLNDSRWAFTELMELGGGLACLLLLLVLLTGFQSDAGGRRLPWTMQLALLSFCLFMLGALFGFLISTNNAMVPAHYHGMMGAVTLSLMGLAYLLSQSLGLALPPARAISLQTRLYAGGLVLVMLGLIVSDVPRKALENDAGGELSQLVGRILIATGGGSALLGTLLFVILMWRAFHAVVVNSAKGLETLE